MKKIGLVWMLFAVFACSKDTKQLLTEGTPTTPIESAPKFVETAPPVLTAVKKKINNYIGGFYESLPSKYKERDDKYPLIIFVHGMGQQGNGTTDLYKVAEEAMIKRIADKQFPPHVTVGKDAYSFIVLAPQFSNHESLNALNSFVNYALKNYRVDASRIYLAGLSLGGRMICDYTAAYPAKIAAVIPMAGVSKNDGSLISKANVFAGNNIPLWAIHNRNDQIMSSDDAKLLVSSILDKNPNHAAMISILSDQGEGNHDSWTRGCDPAFKVDNKNIYQWMLQYSN